MGVVVGVKVGVVDGGRGVVVGGWSVGLSVSGGWSVGPGSVGPTVGRSVTSGIETVGKVGDALPGRLVTTSEIVSPTLEIPLPILEIPLPTLEIPSPIPEMIPETVGRIPPVGVGEPAVGPFVGPFDWPFVMV